MKLDLDLVEVAQSVIKDGLLALGTAAGRRSLTSRPLACGPLTRVRLRLLILNANVA